MFPSGFFKKPGLSRIYRWRQSWPPNTEENVLEFHCFAQEIFHDFPNSSIVSSGQSTHKESSLFFFFK